MRHALDDLDVSILSHLEEDGRRSYSEIADALGVAVSTVSTRVAKLIDRNVVSITAIINPQEVGLEAPATLLIAIQPRFFDEVVETIIACPEVVYASMTTGRQNLIVDVLCRNKWRNQSRRRTVRRPGLGSPTARVNERERLRRTR
jgi:Lrp/AsnC family transcriptional regulator for asnA, asnC and gidA